MTVKIWTLLYDHDDLGSPALGVHPDQAGAFRTLREVAARREDEDLSTLDDQAFLDYLTEQARWTVYIDEHDLAFPEPPRLEVVIQPVEDEGRDPSDPTEPYDLELRCPHCGSDDIRDQDTSVRHNEIEEVERLPERHGWDYSKGAYGTLPAVVLLRVNLQDNDNQDDGLVCADCWSMLALPDGDGVELVYP